MKPNPLVLLKNFTVPVVDIMSSRIGIAARDSARSIKVYLWERTGSASRKRTADRPKAHSTPALWGQIECRDRVHVAVPIRQEFITGCNLGLHNPSPMQSTSK